MLRLHCSPRRIAAITFRSTLFPLRNSSTAAASAVSPTSFSETAPAFSAAAKNLFSQQILDLHSLDYAGWGPSGLVERGLEFLHVFAGLPWWASVISLTVLSRIIITPILVPAMRASVQLAILKPKMDPLIQKVKDAQLKGDSKELLATRTKLTLLYRNHGMTPLSVLKPLVVPLIQIPIFFGFYNGISNLSCLSGLGWDIGGVLWFQNLALPDPSYALPIFNGSLALMAMEFSMLSGRIQAPPSQNILTVMRLVTIITIPFLCNFQSGVFLFWITSSLLQMAQTALLLVPQVRNFVGLPPKERLGSCSKYAPRHQPWHLIEESKLLLRSLKGMFFSDTLMRRVAQKAEAKALTTNPSIRPARHISKRKY